MADVSVAISPLLNGLIKFLDYIREESRKKNIKTELMNALEIPINNAKKSMESFYLAAFCYSGAIIQGNIMHPPNSSETAKKIVNDFILSQDNLVKNFRELVKYFDAHFDEFKQLLSEKDIVSLEAIIKTFESSSGLAVSS